MSTDQKTVWLKRVLAAKAALCLLAWGLPTLIAPISIFHLLGVPTPNDTLFVRLFGAVVTAFGLAYYYAYRDPIRNAAIVRVGIADNGLVTLTILVFILFFGLRSAFMWVSAVLTFAFFICFLVLAPKSEPA
jgi:hypothetical protein